MPDPRTRIAPGSLDQRNATRWRSWAKLGISLGLIGAVLALVDVGEMAETLGQVGPTYILALVALIYLDRALMAYKWGILLFALGVNARLSLLTRIYVVSPLAGTFLPTTVGSDLFRLYVFTREEGRKKAVLASMVVERGIGFIAMLLLAVVSVTVASTVLPEGRAYFRAVAWALAGAAVACLILVGVASHRRFNEWLDRVTRRFRGHTIVAKLHDTYALCRQYRDHSGAVAVVASWTLLEQLAPIVTNFLIVRALDIDVSMWELVAIVPLIVLAVRLPISLDGLGVQERLYVVLFGLVGVSASQAFLVSAVLRATYVVCALPFAAHFALLGRSTERNSESADGASTLNG